MSEDKQVNIKAHGETMAEATISPPDAEGVARVDVQVGSDHLPAGGRQRMADAIHEAVTEDQADRLTATVPLHDAEMIEAIRDHLTDVELRAADATSIIEGDVDPGE